MLSTTIAILAFEALLSYPRFCKEYKGLVHLCEAYAAVDVLLKRNRRMEMQPPSPNNAQETDPIKAELA